MHAADPGRGIAVGAARGQPWHCHRLLRVPRELCSALLLLEGLLTVDGPGRLELPEAGLGAGTSPRVVSFEVLRVGAAALPLDSATATSLELCALGHAMGTWLMASAPSSSSLSSASPLERFPVPAQRSQPRQGAVLGGQQAVLPGEEAGSSPRLLIYTNHSPSEG